MKASNINDLGTILEISPTLKHKYENGKMIYTDEVINIRIPDWCDFEVEPEIFIKEDKGKFVAEKNGVVIFSDPDIVKLYDKVSETNNNIGIYKDSLDLETGGRFLIAITEIDKVLMLKYQLLTFYQIAEQYHNDPNNFTNALNFIEKHLIFWTRNYGGRDWEYHFTPWVEFATNEKGKPICMLEAGEHHVESNYTETCHDYRLDVYAPTYEKAIIKLAKRITKYYNDDGTEKISINQKGT